METKFIWNYLFYVFLLTYICFNFIQLLKSESKLGYSEKVIACLKTFIALWKIQSFDSIPKISKYYI